MSQHYTVQFIPRTYANDEEREYLDALFASQMASVPFTLQLIRQPGHRPKNAPEVPRDVVWALEMPIGLFDNSFNSTSTALVHADQRDALFKAHGIGSNLQIRGKDSFVKNEKPFYRLSALELIEPHLEHPQFIRTAIKFMRFITENPAFITGGPKRRNPILPLNERKIAYGKMVRGAGWSPEEDRILSAWFGIRTLGDMAGYHCPLSEEEWQGVLTLLPMRTKKSIQARCLWHNKQLVYSMQVNGFVPLNRLREYMNKALGEAPRRPPTKMDKKGRKNRAAK